MRVHGTPSLTDSSIFSPTHPHTHARTNPRARAHTHTHTHTSGVEESRASRSQKGTRTCICVDIPLHLNMTFQSGAGITIHHRQVYGDADIHVHTYIHVHTCTTTAASASPYTTEAPGGNECRARGTAASPRSSKDSRGGHPARASRKFSSRNFGGAEERRGGDLCQGPREKPPSAVCSRNEKTRFRKALARTPPATTRVLPLATKSRTYVCMYV